MAQAILMRHAASEAFSYDRRPFEVDPVDPRRAAHVRRQLWRTPPRHLIAEGSTGHTKFERIWTALLLGALTAVPVAMFLGAVLALLLSSAVILYLEMTPVFLICWAMATLACLAARDIRAQWMIALWLGSSALFALAACYLIVPGGDAVATIDMTLGGLLVAVARALPAWLPAR